MYCFLFLSLLAIVNGNPLPEVANSEQNLLVRESSQSSVQAPVVQKSSLQAPIVEKSPEVEKEPIENPVPIKTVHYLDSSKPFFNEELPREVAQKSPTFQQSVELPKEVPVVQQSPVSEQSVEKPKEVPVVQQAPVSQQSVERPTEVHVENAPVSQQSPVSQQHAPVSQQQAPVFQQSVEVPKEVLKSPSGIKEARSDVPSQERQRPLPAQSHSPQIVQTQKREKPNRVANSPQRPVVVQQSAQIAQSAQVAQAPEVSQIQKSPQKPVYQESSFQRPIQHSSQIQQAPVLEGHEKVERPQQVFQAPQSFEPSQQKQMEAQRQQPLYIPPQLQVASHIEPQFQIHRAPQIVHTSAGDFDNIDQQESGTQFEVINNSPEINKRKGSEPVKEDGIKYTANIEKEVSIADIINENGKSARSTGKNSDAQLFTMEKNKMIRSEENKDKVLPHENHHHHSHSKPSKEKFSKENLPNPKEIRKPKADEVPVPVPNLVSEAKDEVNVKLTTSLQAAEVKQVAQPETVKVEVPKVETVQVVNTKKELLQELTGEN